ncbi:hypothetical protein cand_014190 [Cryptosporidium andersoni]|uniref:DNA repair protein RAD51 homolog 3 n=1 Tax=Cryptosporidium andersoni TaxID=117008 RepID=A0A1J4MXG5_9CRYT|nr:hypothetical protein cand_014190 [Cryptosporidium andersoni]
MLGTSALDLYYYESSSSNRIKTFNKTLDKVLGGGIILGKGILELCGIPGSGKTNLCKQLSLNVQIPTSIGGIDRNTLYIDSEGSFSILRLKEMANSLVEKFYHKLDNDERRTFTVNKLIEGVIYLRIFDLNELKNIVENLEMICKQKNLGLIIIDSISMLIRTCNLSNRTYKLKMQDYIANKLVLVSKKMELAVIVTNHMTFKSLSGELENQLDSSKKIEPSLGSSWNSLISSRFILRPIKTYIENSVIFITNSESDTTPFQDGIIEYVGDY